LTHADAARPPLFTRAPSDVAAYPRLSTKTPRPPTPDPRPPIPKTLTTDNRQLTTVRNPPLVKLKLNGYTYRKRLIMAEQMQMVTFQLAEEQYGINILDVKEIVRVQTVRDIPNAPVYVEGIFNLRGEIVPIINLHKRFGLKKPPVTEESELLSGFVIIDIDGMKIGIIIDRVSRVVTIERTAIQPPPQMLSGIGAEYIQGVVRQDEEYLIILNIRSLFNPRELQKIAELRK
jgi:purine-binding chemotaxis protein CheW